jgi:hypothetical protein
MTASGWPAVSVSFLGLEVGGQLWGATTARWAVSFAQSALSFTPVDPRFTQYLWPAALPAVCAWRSLFRRALFLVEEFGTMKKLSLPMALVAAVGWMTFLDGPALAHPGVEGAVLECEDCEDDDEARIHATAVEDTQEEDNES